MANDTVTVSTDVDVHIHVESPAVSGLRIELDHLGVADKPVSVAENSGNAILDKVRPPVLDGSDVLVFFDPALGPGNYSLQLRFSYADDAEPVSPAPLLDGKYDGVL